MRKSILVVLALILISITACTQSNSSIKGTSSGNSYGQQYTLYLYNVDGADQILGTYSKESCLTKRAQLSFQYEGDGTLDPYMCGVDCSLQDSGVVVCYGEVCGYNGCITL